jgi:hypothetical protein
MPNKQESAAIALLRLLWDNLNQATGKSFERLNYAMSLGLQMAIGGGFRFDEKDFAAIEKQFEFNRWGGGNPERFYSLACAVGNVSAAKSYETWLDREPIIADGVTQALSCEFCHVCSERARDRLCVGARFTWHGESVVVTSMSRYPTRAVACSYFVDDGRRRKVKRRFRITLAAVVADRAKRKQEKRDD